MNQAQFIAEAQPIMDAVNDQFTRIFGVDDRQTIEAVTVYSERILDTGRQFKTRYSGTNKELVLKRAQKAIDSIDSHRSPSQSACYPYRDGFAVDVNYWGL